MEFSRTTLACLHLSFYCLLRHQAVNSASIVEVLSDLAKFCWYTLTFVSSSNRPTFWQLGTSSWLTWAMETSLLATNFLSPKFLARTNTLRRSESVDGPFAFLFRFRMQFVVVGTPVRCSSLPASQNLYQSNDCVDPNMTFPSFCQGRVGTCTLLPLIFVWRSVLAFFCPL